MAAALAEFSDTDRGLSVSVWIAGQPPPAGVESVSLFVAGYSTTATPVADLARMPNLKVIQVLTAGVEAWLDRVPSDVVLCSGQGIHGGSTAELALAGILNHRRELSRFAASQRRGEWEKHATAGLRHCRVLVLGAGDIGDRVASAARTFDADVTVVARRARPGVHELAELPALLPDADVVVLALPNTPETTGLVDAAFLAALPDGALVVNVARGALVVTEALLSELNRQRLFAFLDVFEVEPIPAGDPLWSAPNLVITPHIGGGTTGWAQDAERLVHDQVGRFLRAEPLANVVSDGY
jgi:phosphoglycerate dehydrogenase-like enzyme